jgi:uncharacterized membrane protein
MSLENEIGHIHSKSNDSAAADLHDASKIHYSIAIAQAPEFVFAFWRDFKNLPLFMKNLASVEVISSKLSTWTVDLDYNAQATWDAEIIAESPGQMISWRSIGDSEVEQAGSVWFLQGPRENTCVVRLHMAYALPGGWLAELLTKLVGQDVDTLVKNSLTSLKDLLESEPYSRNTVGVHSISKNNFTKPSL